MSDFLTPDNPIAICMVMNIFDAATSRSTAHESNAMIDLTRLPDPGQEFRLVLQVGESEPVYYADPDAFQAAIDATAGVGWIRTWRDLFDGTQQVKGRYWR